MLTIHEFSRKYFPNNGFTLITNEIIDKYNEYFRDNAEVGDGATVCLWSDREAYTIIKRTPKTLTIRRCKAIKDPSFKPEWIPGGFSAICVNQDQQKWTYEENENGRTVTVHWSEKYKRFRDHDCIVTPGRHEFYDYNF